MGKVGGVVQWRRREKEVSEVLECINVINIAIAVGATAAARVVGVGLPPPCAAQRGRGTWPWFRLRATLGAAAEDADGDRFGGVNSDTLSITRDGSTERQRGRVKQAANDVSTTVHGEHAGMVHGGACRATGELGKASQVICLR